MSLVYGIKANEGNIKKKTVGGENQPTSKECGSKHSTV
jgi:hypothetical protein